MSGYFVSFIFVFFLFSLSVSAVSPFTSLKTVPVPGPSSSEIDVFIRDKKAVIQLGKALFWDMKVGSDNKTACASCHFHAGADNRRVNQVSPGILAGDNTFQFAKPNHRLLANEFPIPFVSSNNFNDVVSSQGVFNTLFNKILSRGVEECSDSADLVFHGLSANGSKLNTRRVEPRNTPTVINAVFNFRNFWDGRANNMFNGLDPFGKRNPDAVVWRHFGGLPQQVKISLPFSSLASQASGPPLSAFEMSCRERVFVDIGRKMLNLSMLSSQTIHPSDSVLGAFSSARLPYLTLIQRGFRPEWWNSTILIPFTTAEASRARSMDIGRGRVIGNRRITDRMTLLEANFSLFFSLAIQMYSSTLVSDDSPADRYAEGVSSALTAQQIRGKNVFENKGRCVNCHGGAETTNASVANVFNQRLETMEMGDGNMATYDNGFYNIGVRPTSDDLGVGGTDPFGMPLSETRMVKAGKSNLLGGFNPDQNPRPQDINRIAVNGAFKTPGLRNIELTGPYFHNGGKSTLRQVVDFYDRGGDFSQQNMEDLDPDIRSLNLTELEKQDLVAFLISLTDPRVKLKKAPFDHPSLCIPDGHKNDEQILVQDGVTLRALDNTFCMKAVGSAGVSSLEALKPFLEVNHFIVDEK